MILTSSVHYDAAQDAILATLDRCVVIVSSVHCHWIDDVLLLSTAAAGAVGVILGIHVQQGQAPPVVGGLRTSMHKWISRARNARVE